MATSGQGGELERLADAVRGVGSGLLVAVTGAGISAASGIAVFRGTDESAIWNRSPMELATRAFFDRDPVTQWRWYLARFDSVFAATPNAAHRALAALERWQEARGGTFRLVTQNIDTLHEQAGSRSMIKVHGTADRVRCSRAGCPHGAPRGSLTLDEADLAPFREAPGPDTLPRCPACASVLRAHVLFFDEYYAEHEDYAFEGVQDALARMQLVLFVGTSFSVGVTDLATREAGRRGVPAWSIDPEPAAEPAVRPLARPAERALPELCALLGAGVSGR